MIRAEIFIDLDSARRFKRTPWRKEDESSVSFANRCAFIVDLFGELQVKIATSISEMQLGSKVTISRSRIYHGWHRGLTPTQDRRIWQEAALSFRAYTMTKVSYLPDVAFGNELICGGKRVPLYDTLRNQDGIDRQKLVDTSLVADVICFARSESSGVGGSKGPSSMGVILADDDDILPGAFVAERWGLPIRVLRVTRAGENKHIDTRGMVGKI